jgi:hypothetical protein
MPGNGATGDSQDGLAEEASPPVRQDSELVQVHAAAGRFFQSRLAGSWVPGYLASRRLDAVLMPASPWKIGYAPSSGPQHRQIRLR